MSFNFIKSLQDDTGKKNKKCLHVRLVGKYRASADNESFWSDNIFGCGPCEVVRPSLQRNDLFMCVSGLVDALTARGNVLSFMRHAALLFPVSVRSERGRKVPDSTFLFCHIWGMALISGWWCVFKVFSPFSRVEEVFLTLLDILIVITTLTSAQ